MRCLKIKSQFGRRDSRSKKQALALAKTIDLEDKSETTISAVLQRQFQSIAGYEMRAATLPDHQQQLQLHAPKESFKLEPEVPLPQPSSDGELLIEVKAIGLNPVDWKGPAFNFGLPTLPCVLGRDLVGVVIRPPIKESKLKVGDVVLAVSTDYRDYRKAAFQEYAVANDFNVCRIPESVSADASASLGVAFVSAALILGVCLGAKTTNATSGTHTPDLWKMTRSIPSEKLPEDIREECLNTLGAQERISAGDWLAIWGASSTVGFILLQLAKKVGIKVVCIADAVKHGELLVKAGADVLVHRPNEEDAVKITRSVTGNKLKFAVDTVGKETAELLQSALTSSSSSSTGDRIDRRHLVGLTGMPKDSAPGIVKHKVPIKLFHESPEIGQAIMTWLEHLLLEDNLLYPKVDMFETSGLEGINPALDQLRSGSTSAQRIVVPL